MKSVSLKEIKTFVLVHGTWHGGWCWSKVAAQLRDMGHLVFTPTLTGLGERRHLLTATVNMDTHITDIKELILAEELHDVVLVGHSYGGLIIAGVADLIPQRISHLVFLDAPILENGEKLWGKLPEELQEITLQVVKDFGEGISIPAIPATDLGIQPGPDADWVNRRLTPHPLASQQQKYQLKNPLGNGIRKTFISCTDPILFILYETLPKVKNNPDWEFLEILTGHEAMITEPVKLAEMLMK
jgi:pimeloyl-ACP methyl ester carboxylesterase